MKKESCGTKEQKIWYSLFSFRLQKTNYILNIQKQIDSVEQQCQLEWFHLSF